MEKKKSVKPAAKAAPKVVTKVVEKLPVKIVERPTGEKLHDMSVEVRDWIASAHSRINHLTSKVERLEGELLLAKKANRVMEMRVMGTSNE